MTGSGFSKFLNVQNRKFLAVTCSNCKYTEFYKGQMKGWENVIDFLGNQAYMLTERRHDIDALRVIVLFLLIGYHAAVAFQPWGWDIAFISNDKSLESLWIFFSLILSLIHI